jgi:hypothetical protein
MSLKRVKPILVEYLDVLELKKGQTELNFIVPKNNKNLIVSEYVN